MNVSAVLGTSLAPVGVGVGVKGGGIIICWHAGAVVGAESRYQQCCRPLCIEKQTKGAAKEHPRDGWV